MENYSKNESNDDSLHMFDYKQTITLPQTVKRKVTKEFSALGDYFQSLSKGIDTIFEILKKYGITPLQEDFTPWDGFFIGSSGKAAIVLGFEDRVVKNCKLNLTWYQSQSRMEIVKYLS